MEFDYKNYKFNVKLPPDVKDRGGNPGWSAARAIKAKTWVRATYPNIIFFHTADQFDFDDEDIAMHFKMVWG